MTDALAAAAQIARSRFIFYGTPEYLEEAISRTRAHLISTSSEDPKYGNIVKSLEGLEKRRLKNFGITHAVPEAHPSNPETISLPSFSDLIASLPEMNAMESASMATKDYRRHLDAVKSMIRITDGTDIDEAIKYCRLLLASLQKRSVHPITMTDLIILRSGEFFHHTFKLTNNTEYLNESIDVHRGMVKTSHSQWTQFPVIRRLISSLFSWFRLFKDKKDFDEMMQLSPIAANNTYEKITRRFNVACQWAHWAWFYEDSSMSTAYECAMSLMQEADRKSVV